MTMRKIDDHVGELLSGYIDGELTQQDRQRVALHCENCAMCSASLAELEALRQRVGRATLSAIGQDVWRETMNDKATKATRGLGWLLLAGGVLVAAGIGVYEFLSNGWTTLSVAEKTIVVGIYGGLLLLFLSVLRQRLVERKSDKYKDVEI